MDLSQVRAGNVALSKMSMAKFSRFDIIKLSIASGGHHCVARYQNLLREAIHKPRQ